MSAFLRIPRAGKKVSGKNATTLDETPCNFSVTQNSMVIPKMHDVRMAWRDHVNCSEKSIWMDLPLGGKRRSKIRHAINSMMITRGTARIIQVENVI